MSKIEHIIPLAAFELVRDRIATILADEFAKQYQLTGDKRLKVNVFTETTVPIDKTKLPAIDVMVAEGEWDNQHQGSSRGKYTFFVDCHTRAKSVKNQTGDTKSAISSQRLAAICRYILDDPIYKTLGFKPPFLSRRAVEKMNFGSPNPVDAEEVRTTRLAFEVDVNECNKLLDPPIIESYKTEVKLEETDNGYLYIGVTYE